MLDFLQFNYRAHFEMIYGFHYEMISTFRDDFFMTFFSGKPGYNFVLVLQTLYVYIPRLKLMNDVRAVP